MVLEPCSWSVYVAAMYWKQEKNGIGHKPGERLSMIYEQLKYIKYLMGDKKKKKSKKVKKKDSAQVGLLIDMDRYRMRSISQGCRQIVNDCVL